MASLNTAYVTTALPSRIFAQNSVDTALGLSTLHTIMHGINGNGSNGNHRGQLLRPFLRWAGGKTHLIHHLLQSLPKGHQTALYREPFLGAGSLFFAMKPNKAILSDANEHLISCYQHVRDNYAAVHRYLSAYGGRSTKSGYYEVRERYRQSRFSAAQAARFIYLNKTCFNGIFRVNTKGQFNVPYGWKKKPALPDSERLKDVSMVLQKAELRVSGFQDALDEAGAGDFVYLDPPYPALNGTAYFTHYTPNRFSNLDQENVAAACHELDRKGCLFLVSNADTEKIRTLYRRYTCRAVDVTRFLTCQAKYSTRELLITNYEPDICEQ
jgi:DNA adenine methylase